MISAMLSLVITILVLGLVVWLLIYVIDLLPVPAPFGQIARVVVMVFAVICLIYLLLGLIGPHYSLRL